MQRSHDPRTAAEAERRAAADAALRGVDRDAEVVGGSLFARRLKSRAERIGDHFAAADAPAEDAVEIWGRRIGRGLALLAAVALIAHLGGELRLW